MKSNFSLVKKIALSIVETEHKLPVGSNNMGLLQETSILTGDAWRRTFCLVNNLVNPNKARVEKIVNYGERTMHVSNEDGSYQAVLRGEHIPDGPAPAANFSAQMQQAVFANYEISRHVKWNIVFDSQQAGK